MRNDASHADPPDIQLAGLSLWIHGRAYPHATDYWDGNWLHVTAVCEAAGARIRVTGTFLHLSEFTQWWIDCTDLAHQHRRDAHLACFEPTLDVVLALDRSGDLTIDVSLTPDSLTQQHHMQFTRDQTDLPPFLAACADIVRRYPIKDPPAPE